MYTELLNTLLLKFSLSFNVIMSKIIRPRRLRRTEAIREMVRENHLMASDFIYPLFIHEKDFKEEISASPEFIDGILMA